MATHLLTRRRQVAIETEATAGTAESLVAADVLVRVMDDVDFDTSGFESHEQGLTQADVGMEPNIIGLRPVPIRMSTVLSGSGTADTPPGWGAEWLQHGGFLQTVNASTSVVYTPESGTTTNPATVGVWSGPTTGSNGTLEIAKGCRPHRMNFRLNAGQIPVLETDWMGAFDSKRDAAEFSSPTYTATANPQSVRNSNMTIGSWRPVFTDFNIQVERGGYIPPDAAAASNDSGLSFCRLTDKRIGGTITIAEVLESEKAWIDDLLAGTTAAMSITIGSGAGNTLTFAVAQFQLLPPSNTTIDGLVGKSIPWQAVRDTTADNELTITHT